jgi:hypothetical protein
LLVSAGLPCEIDCVENSGLLWNLLANKHEIAGAPAGTDADIASVQIYAGNSRHVQ